MNKPKLVMCGCHIAGKPIVESIIKAGYKFDYFVCLTEEQGKKNNVSGYYDFTQLAKENNIAVYYPQSYTLKNDTDITFFKNEKFDSLIQGGWQRLFPDEVITSLKIGALGFHGSSDFLPKGRGRSPMNWSLIENKERFIMHLFLIKPGIDDGNVIDFEFFDINPFDDIETLYYKYSIINRNLILKNLPLLLSGKFKTHAQKGVPSYYAKRTAQDGKIDWENMDVKQIYNLVRAITKPYPGAFATINDREYVIWKCRLFDTRINYPSAKYGDCVEDFDGKWVINCRGGLLLLDKFEDKIS